MDQPALALPPTPDFDVYPVDHRLSRVEIERDVLRVLERERSRADLRDDK